MGTWLAANQTAVIIAVVLVGLYAAVQFGPGLLQKMKDMASGKSTVDPAADFQALLTRIKTDAALSAPSRATICTLLVVIDTAVEYLPNLADREAGREQVRGLGGLFQVTPNKAADDKTVTTK